MSAYIAKSLAEAKQVYEHDLQASPSEESWQHQETELECRIRRNSSLGTYSGYVRLPREVQTTEVLCLVDAVKQSVHGGITYCDGIMLGFDCAHLGDYSPHHAQLRVWTMDAVKNQVETLAKAVRRYFGSR
jgi:hypothetical protein